MVNSFDNPRVLIMAVYDGDSFIINERFLHHFSTTCLLQPSTLGRQLRLSEPEIQRIISDNRDNYLEQKFQLLRRWLGANPATSLRALRKAVDSGIDSAIELMKKEEKEKSPDEDKKLENLLSTNNENIRSHFNVIKRKHRDEVESLKDEIKELEGKQAKKIKCDNKENIP
jgi:hypothetical protein